MTPQPTHWFYLLGAWLLAAIASLAALYIGEVLGQTPCILCWFQRTFMFPLAIILGIACFQSDFKVWRYALPLTLMGGLIALGHSLLYMGLIPQPIQPCSATGPSCSGENMTLFGLIPLPYIALAVFIAIAALLEPLRRREQQ